MTARGGSVQSQPQTVLGVASADTPTISGMERGVGGRIEDAFEAAKARGEAAFVTFITAGYPAAQGMSGLIPVKSLGLLPDKSTNL